MAKTTIWITGAGGLIGNHLLKSAREHTASARVIGLTRAELDLADHKAVRSRFRKDSPALIIHCAAMSSSVDCESDPEAAWLQNVDTVRTLVALCNECYLVFFSTDLVFDGTRGHYREDDVTNPLSVYARTKVAAEEIVLANPRHCVVRTSLNGGTSPHGDRGFNEALRAAWKKRRTLKLFTDEYRCPLPAEVTARAAWELAGKRAAGIWHVAGSQRLSRWQIGELIAQRCPELKPRIKPESLKDHKGAPRPPDCSLNCDKAQSVLSFPLPGLAEWLETHPEAEF